MPVQSNWFSPTDILEVVIFAYDEKLTDYITTSPSAIWPNTYQPAYSTVTNGYGCFGSLNLVKKKVDFSAL